MGSYMLYLPVDVLDDPNAPLCVCRLLNCVEGADGLLTVFLR